jgi:hypothetical protein
MPHRIPAKRALAKLLDAIENENLVARIEPLLDGKGPYTIACVSIGRRPKWSPDQKDVRHYSEPIIGE